MHYKVTFHANGVQALLLLPDANEQVPEGCKWSIGDLRKFLAMLSRLAESVAGHPSISANLRSYCFRVAPSSTV
jgi:hypothetical protein